MKKSSAVTSWLKRIFILCLQVMLTLQVLSPIMCVEGTGAPRWWNIIRLLQLHPSNSTHYPSYVAEPIICTQVPGLGTRQLRFCSSNTDLMPSIAHGTKMGIDQCKHQFSDRRWNCPTQPLRTARPIRRRNVFGPVLERASKEAAFVHAINSAGVAHSITKACSSGDMRSCGCDDRVKEKTPALQEIVGGKWSWSGCSDDVQYGVAASRQFVDAPDQGRDARAIMNRHNNEAGRQVLLRKMQIKCKCHGVSGSCQFRTCLWALPHFNNVGSELKQMYVKAKNMRVERHLETRGIAESLVPGPTTLRPPTTNDLVYYQESHDYCERDDSLGIQGTSGRLCNATSDGVDNCNLLCCGRGYTTAHKTRVEKCRCRFQWCCTVTCEECIVHYEEHTCI
nr:wingless-type MMTV integration site family, member 3 isoform X1 [Ciona intestinalis]|eukprot:XP_009859675.1 wingless-type MMTV integration site family, member 3 isoform X1 [Ciona intestinalis]